MLAPSPIQTVHQIGEVTFQVDKRYVDLQILGHGSFGTVCAAYDSTDKCPVAIKKISNAFRNRLAAERLYREILMLRKFKHRNIVSLLGIEKPLNRENDDDVYLITDLMSCDLRRLTYSNVCFTEFQIKNMLYQTFLAVAYMHDLHVLHRDLKPSNILVDFATGIVKVADFGLSTRYHKNMDRNVVTRWYRAPELLYPDVLPYDESVDIWSVGCVLAELILRRPLFAGKDNRDQLTKIVEVMGTPTRFHFLESRTRQAFERIGFKKGTFDELFETVNPQIRDLLRQCLHYCPHQRPAAVRCLRHQFFADVFHESDLQIKGEIDLSAIDSPLDSTKSYRLLIQREIESFYPAPDSIDDAEFYQKMQDFINSDLPIGGMPALDREGFESTIMGQETGFDDDGKFATPLMDSKDYNDLMELD